MSGFDVIPRIAKIIIHLILFFLYVTKDAVSQDYPMSPRRNFLSLLCHSIVFYLNVTNFD